MSDVDFNELLSGAKKKAKKIANKAAVKANETAEAAKLEVELRKAQQTLDKEYKALGQIEFHIENGAMKRDDSVIEAACERIQEAIDQIIALQQQKDDAKYQKSSQHAEAKPEASEEKPADETPEEEPETEASDEEAGADTEAETDTPEAE